ncbi:hypothetical protein CesoFtcFv8_004480 [Champsocephalus esox]|nr:hypothetical protein CesoFtcFv8_004480 [Champsocephalus esox]
MKSCAGVQCGGGGSGCEGSFRGQKGKAGGRCKPPPQALTATQEGDHRRSAPLLQHYNPPPTSCNPIAHSAPPPHHSSSKTSPLFSL